MSVGLTSKQIGERLEIALKETELPAQRSPAPPDQEARGWAPSNHAPLNKFIAVVKGDVDAKVARLHELQPTLYPQKAMFTWPGGSVPIGAGAAKEESDELSAATGKEFTLAQVAEFAKVRSDIIVKGGTVAPEKICDFYAKELRAADEKPTAAQRLTAMNKVLEDLVALDRAVRTAGSPSSSNTALHGEVPPLVAQQMDQLAALQPKLTALSQQADAASQRIVEEGLGLGAEILSRPQAERKPTAREAAALNRFQDAMVLVDACQKWPSATADTEPSNWLMATYGRHEQTIDKLEGAFTWEGKDYAGHIPGDDLFSNRAKRDRMQTLRGKVTQMTPAASIVH